MMRQNTTGHPPQNRRHGKARGFTLIELVIAISIIGVLAAIAIPSYQRSANKNRHTGCTAGLVGFAHAMERHAISNNNSYEGAGPGGNATGVPTIFPSQVPIDGTNKSCDLIIQAATPSTFTLRAIPINAYASSGTGNFELDSTGARRWDRNGNGNFEAGENCWENAC